MRKTVAILGVPVDDLDTDEVLQRLEEFIPTGRFHQVATANTDFLVRAARDPELRSILRTADLVVPDGMPLVMASRWLGTPLRERVTGADLVPALADVAARKGYTVFLLGARPEVARTAQERLLERYPTLRIVGCVSPPVAPIVDMDHDALLTQIAAVRPDILLVAFGNPKQEKWIAMHRHRLAVPVCIGIGGTLDFIAGAIPRAPGWMQRSGLERLFRLAQEPRRLWRRYGADLVHFANYVLTDLRLMRAAGAASEGHLADTRFDDGTVISITGSLSAANLADFQHRAGRALSANTHLVLDLQGLRGIDSAAMGTLINLPKRAAYVGRQVRLAGMPRKIERMIRASRALDLFAVYPTVADALRGGRADELEPTLQCDGTTAVLTLYGHAGVGQEAPLSRALSMVDGTYQRVDIDLRHIGYIDTAALTLLRRFAREQSDRGGRVCLVQGAVLSLALQEANLQKAFELVSAPVSMPATSVMVETGG